MKYSFPIFLACTISPHADAANSAANDVSETERASSVKKTRKLDPATTGAPTKNPTRKPTKTPTRKPTKTPTAAPTFAAWSGGGCPKQYALGTSYNMGDAVAFDGLVYKCKSVSAAAAMWCGMNGYEPKEGLHWEMAWERLGSCTGSITPTTSPNYSTLADYGGCPGPWETKGAGDSYEPGSKVSANGLVFECNVYPYNQHCGQIGYEPMVDSGTPDAWKNAWTVKGYCEGSMSPTSAPNFSSLSLYGNGCPEEYVSGTDYNAGDKIAYTVSSSPKRAVVYECKQGGPSGWCPEPAFGPGKTYTEMAWTKKGYCEGTIAPTSSPVVFIPDIPNCMNEVTVINGNITTVASEPIVAYNSAKTYKAGDIVRIGAKKFKCKPYPYTGWCNQAVYEPKLEAGYWSDAWTTDGTCDSAFPTSTPSISVAPSLSKKPSAAPSLQPSGSPTTSKKPSLKPSTSPSLKPSLKPSTSPSLKPSASTVVPGPGNAERQ